MLNFNVEIFFDFQNMFLKLLGGIFSKPGVFFFAHSFNLNRLFIHRPDEIHYKFWSFKPTYPLKTA